MHIVLGDFYLLKDYVLSILTIILFSGINNNNNSSSLERK